MLMCDHAAVSNSLNAGFNSSGPGSGWMAEAGPGHARQHSVNTTPARGGGSTITISRQNLDLLYQYFTNDDY